MFDGAEVNEAEVLAWISKELATNEVVSDLDLINCQLIATNEVLSDFDLIYCQLDVMSGQNGEQSRRRDVDHQA